VVFICAFIIGFSPKSSLLFCIACFLARGKNMVRLWEGTLGSGLPVAKAHTVKGHQLFFNSFIPLHLQSVFIDVSYGVTKAAATLITPDTADCYAHALRTLGRFFEETANHELEILRMSRANGRVGAHGPRCFVSAKHGLLQAAAELHYCRRLADWREVNLDRMTTTPAGGIDALINGQ
jgi:hypothetical protein